MSEGKDIKIIKDGEFDKKEEEAIIPEDIPVIFIRDLVVFPYMALPLHVGREKSKNAIDEALRKDRMILLVTQKDAKTEDPKEDEVYKVGTVTLILRMLKLSTGDIRLFVQGIKRAKIKELKADLPFPRAKIEVIEEQQPEKETLEIKALKRNVKEGFEKFVQLGKQLPPELVFYIQDIEDLNKLSDNIISYLSINVDIAQNILEETNPVNRLNKVYELLLKEIKVLQVQNEISNKAKEEIDNLQKEYILRQQLKAIKEQLGETGEINEEIKNYRKKIEETKFPEEAKEEVERQLSRLEKMHPESAESNVIRNYLDWMLSLPWAKKTKDNLNIKKAQKILNEDHYDLEKVKERILEFLAVRKLTKKNKGPILCFVGPPGVGKTSLGKSIARAMGRKFVRTSLGGVHDEAEIRGHRRTYVGALPGRIIQSIRQAGSNNPVFMLDEVDKIGADFRGDPSSALLEVLDPEQNHSFRDNYLGVPFDLSNVLFIATANVLDTIQPAFRDRMEIIFLSGYTDEEKLHIAKKYLIPRQKKENGLRKGDLSFSDKAILKIINEYTRESGVRNLERTIGSVCRKIVKKIAEKGRKRFRITDKNLEKYLGYPKIFRDQLLKENTIGVATGLAWTPSGGDILFIESIIMKGKGGLILTGSLGNVMKESATAALSYLKANHRKFKIKDEAFKNKDVHIHVPEGAIPKDGPSAGVTIFTSIVSLLTYTPVKKDIAMTGEITLQGRVLPVGGIKSKVLAALRAGITTVILPSYNEKDLDEIPKQIRKKMKFIFVNTVDEVIKNALIKDGKKPVDKK
jgi:ATP-dependent Lon protease